VPKRGNPGAAILQRKECERRSYFSHQTENGRPRRGLSIEGWSARRLRLPPLNKRRNTMSDILRAIGTLRSYKRCLRGRGERNHLCATPSYLARWSCSSPAVLLRPRLRLLPWGKKHRRTARASAAIDFNPIVTPHWCQRLHLNRLSQTLPARLQEIALTRIHFPARSRGLFHVSAVFPCVD
jgi:hypothetical protein